MNVLILVSHYLPGFKAGGPIRSLANLVARLSDEFEFQLITRDRDLGDGQPFPGVRSNSWQRVGSAQVAYIRPSYSAAAHIARAIRTARPDLVYVNSLFDGPWCISPLLMIRSGAISATPVIIAPRGQLSPGALQFNTLRKRSYLAALKSLGLMRQVIWHATSDSERADIHRVIAHNAKVTVAPNISDAVPSLVSRDAKQSGHLKLAFYSRVTPKKNLLGAIDLLRHAPGKVTFDIWGPIEDAKYAERCRQRIAELPTRIDVCWRGPVAPDGVTQVLSQYDGLLLPTLGENFGHVIVEALAAGCPVVISDHTPWRGLEKSGVGWDLPLDCPDAFQRAMSSLACMDESTHRLVRSRAVEYAIKRSRAPENAELHRELFRAGLCLTTQPQPARVRQAA